MPGTFHRPVYRLAEHSCLYDAWCFYNTNILNQGQMTHLDLPITVKTLAYWRKAFQGSSCFLELSSLFLLRLVWPDVMDLQTASVNTWLLTTWLLQSFSIFPRCSFTCASNNFTLSFFFSHWTPSHQINCPHCWSSHWSKHSVGLPFLLLMPKTYVQSAQSCIQVDTFGLVNNRLHAMVE